MHPNVHCSTVLIAKDMDTIYLSIDRGMTKEDMTHICIMKYYLAIKKSKIMPFEATWMNLEIVTLGEASHTEKEKYCMTPYMQNLK